MNNQKTITESIKAYKTTMMTKAHDLDGLPAELSSVDVVYKDLHLANVEFLKNIVHDCYDANISVPDSLLNSILVYGNRITLYTYCKKTQTVSKELLNSLVLDELKQLELLSDDFLKLLANPQARQL